MAEEQEFTAIAYFNCIAAAKIFSEFVTWDVSEIVAE